MADASPKIFEAPFPWPPQDEEVRSALLAAWEDGSWGRYHADHTTRLEDILTQHHGVEHAILCCSGTMAVELALRGGKIGPGDEVILAAYDFPGNFRAIEAVGARPVLVDLLPSTWAIDPSQIEAAVSQQTKAVIVSHLHGTLVDMPTIMALARKKNLFVIEDACQMHGGLIAGKPAGSWGDTGILSFGGSKLISAGRGGAILTRSDEVKQRITVFADRGNQTFPFSQLQSTVVVPQWGKLEERNQIRAHQVARLRSQLTGIGCFEQPPDVPSRDEPAYYKLAWLLRSPPTESQRGEAPAREHFLAAAEQLGLPLDAGFRGFARRGSSRCRSLGDLQHARKAAECTVVLHHPILLQPDEVIDRLGQGIKQIAEDTNGSGN